MNNKILEILKTSEPPSDAETVRIPTVHECHGFGDRIIRIGDTVCCPANTSDPACGIVHVILNMNWPTVPASSDSIQLTKYGCLVEYRFSNSDSMWRLEPADLCAKCG